MSAIASPDLVVELTEALHGQLSNMRVFGLVAEPVTSFMARTLAEATAAHMQARGHLYWRPTATCLCCKHTAELVSTTLWSCNSICCCCTRGGGCKVEPAA